MSAAAAPGPYTALVLAGSRGAVDPVAAHCGVRHKALAPVAGVPMLARVLRTLADSPYVWRIAICIEEPTLLEGLPEIQALRTAWGIRAHQQIVLLPGRLTGWKGQRVLIEAARILRDQGDTDTAFILAGDHQGRDGYVRELDQLITQASNDNIPLIDLGLSPPAGNADAFWSAAHRYGVTPGSEWPADVLADYTGSVLVVVDREKAPSVEALKAAKAAGIRVAFSSGGLHEIDESRLRRRIEAIRAAGLGWRDFWVPGKP